MSSPSPTPTPTPAPTPHLALRSSSPDKAHTDDGASATGATSGGGGKRKQRPKKGWKGWALLVEDEEGNVIEERKGGHSPPRPGEGEGVRPSVSPAMSLPNLPDISREGSEALPSTAPGSRNRFSPKILPRSLERVSKSATPAPSASHDAPGSTFAASRKRPRTSLSSTPQSQTQALPPVPSSRENSRPPSSSRPATSSGLVDAAPRAGTPLSTSTTVATAPLTNDRPLSATHVLAPPVRAASKPKPRLSAPTRTSTAALREAANSAAHHAQAVAQVQSQLGSADDDGALPRMPRVGMGDVHAPPPESDIRSEAFYIIHSASRHREEEAKHLMRQQARRDLEGGDDDDELSPPPPLTDADTPDASKPSSRVGRPPGFGGITNGPRVVEGRGRRQAAVAARSLIANGVAHDDDDDDDVRMGEPSSSSRAARRASLDQAPFQPRRSSVQTNGTTAGLGSAPDDFDVLFAKTVSAYKSGKYTQPEEDWQPPKILASKQPTIVLATKARPRDKFDKQRLEGLDGLVPDLQGDVDGFIQSVRSNAKTLVDFHFPKPSGRRDAFIESIGRGLGSLGQAMTDSADGAF